MYCIINDDIQSSDDKKVPWWSFGKTVLATAILKLVENGELKLEEKYLIDGTLKQLLRHETGLSDYGGSKAYHEAVDKNQAPWSFDEMIEKTNRKELLFNPGEGWMYSNIGYYYIRRIIEETMHLSLQESLNILLFEPLSLDVKVAEENSDLRDCIHVRENYRPKWLYHGMLVGSVESACQFLHHLANGKIINESMLNELLDVHELHFDIGDRPWKKPSYGLGIMMDLSDRSYGHTGMGPDSVIAIYHFPKEKTTIGVSMNTQDQGIVEFKVKELLEE